MKRLNIGITDKQFAALSIIVKENETKISELIRLSVDMFLDHQKKPKGLKHDRTYIR